MSALPLALAKKVEPFPKISAFKNKFQSKKILLVAE